MPIGDTLPPQWKRFTDPAHGREVRLLTRGDYHSYPLSYQGDPVTLDERYLILHAERTGWLQLYRLDLHTGEQTQLTDADTRNSGWALWCEPNLRGVYAHLASLNPLTREVCYFQHQQLRATHVESLHNRLILDLPGRVPVSLSTVSPNGRLLAFAHADEATYRLALADKLAVEAMRQRHRLPYQLWRKSVPVTLCVLNLATGSIEQQVELDHHVSELKFQRDDRLLVSHVPDGLGCWMLNLADGSRQTILTRTRHGDPGHCVVTRSGLFYDRFLRRRRGRHPDTASPASPASALPAERRNWMGRYDDATERAIEVPLPLPGRVHTGRDPDGRFHFFEHQWKQRELCYVTHPRDDAQRRVHRLLKLHKIGRNAGQRFHAHPFLTPSRVWMIYTDIHDGFAQVCAIDVESLVDQKSSWFA